MLVYFILPVLIIISQDVASLKDKVTLPVILLPFTISVGCLIIPFVKIVKLIFDSRKEVWSLHKA
jgi:uncharacterized integral membrane protein